MQAECPFPGRILLYCSSASVRHQALSHISAASSTRNTDPQNHNKTGFFATSRQSLQTKSCDPFMGRSTSLCGVLPVLRFISLHRMLRNNDQKSRIRILGSVSQQSDMLRQRLRPLGHNPLACKLNRDFFSKSRCPIIHSDRLRRLCCSG